MADAVTSRVLTDGGKNYILHLTGVSDGTGESAVQKVDVSALIDDRGNVITGLTLQETQWNIQGFSYVKLAWDATTDDTMVVLSGSGYKNFGDAGGLPDPQSTGYTGDIKLTSAGAAADASYDIVARFTKKA